jgi:hypothetical protein
VAEKAWTYRNTEELYCNEHGIGMVRATDGHGQECWAKFMRTGHVTLFAEPIYRWEVAYRQLRAIVTP